MRARASCGERLSRGCGSKRTGSTRAYLRAGCARIYIFVHTGSCQVSRSNSCKPCPHLPHRQMPPRSPLRLMHRSRRHWSRRNCQPRRSQNRLCCSCRTRKLPQRACYRNHPPPLLQVDLCCVLRLRAKIWPDALELCQSDHRTPEDRQSSAWHIGAVGAAEQKWGGGSRPAILPMPTRAWVALFPVAAWL